MVEKRGDLRKKKIVTAKDRTQLLDVESMIINDRPAPFVARITLNRPEIENRLNNAMKAQLFEQLQLNDQDPDVRVTVIRGAGEHFCSGNETVQGGANNMPLPFFTDESDGQLQRNALAGWFMMQDLGKPVIAQVHGNCLGSGNELASACDMVYVAENAKIGYPEIRNYGLPDTQMYPWLTGMRNALSIMLLAETMDGETAVERGWATGLHSNGELEAAVMDKAKRVAKIPADLLAYNKRSVYRAFEAQGMRANLRHGTDLEALMFHSQSGSMIRRAEQQAGQPPRRRTGGENGRKPSRKAASSASSPAEVKKPAVTAKNDPIAAKAKEPPLVAKKVAKKTPAVPIDPSRIPNPASVAAQIVPTPVNNSTPVNNNNEEEQKIYIQINQPLTIHIHNDEDELHSKL